MIEGKENYKFDLGVKRLEKLNSLSLQQTLNRYNDYSRNLH